MSLSDIMSAAGLAGYAEAGLVIFLITFVAIAIRTFAGSRRDDWEHARLLPLATDSTIPNPAVSERQGDMP